MPRIRTIKPEFWSSPAAATLDPIWRLLFIAMWNWADDTGRGTAEARELMGFAFPLDEEMTVADFRRGLVEIHRAFDVKFYSVGGRHYYAIPSWDKHQKIDRRSGAKFPAPEEGEPYDPGKNCLVKHLNTEDSWKTHEYSAENIEDSGTGTGEQGNRGTDTLAQPSCADAKPRRKRRNQ